MRTFLKIKVEKIIEVEGGAEKTLTLHAGSYEQTVPMAEDSGAVELFKKIVSIVNDLAMP